MSFSLFDGHSRSSSDGIKVFFVAAPADPVLLVTYGDLKVTRRVLRACGKARAQASEVGDQSSAPMALSRTTSHGGVFHMNSSRNAAQRQREVERPRDARGPDRVVERGEQQADHRGVDAAQRRLRARGRRRSASQNGSAPTTSRNDGRKIATRQSAAPSPAVRRGPHHRAEIGGEGEQRPGHGLRRAVAGEERVVGHPARRHHRGLQQRQHHMAAAEHQRAGAVEASNSATPGSATVGRQERQPDQQREEEREHDDARRAG